MSDQNQAEMAASAAETPAPQPTVSSDNVISDAAWVNATSNWINGHVRNTPIAAAVEAWNHLGAALPHLRRYLEDEFRNNR